MKANRFFLTTLLIITLSSLSLSACSSKTSGSVIYGKVTAINGTTLTIAVGTLNENRSETTSSTTTSSQDSTTQSADSSTTSPPTPPADSGTGTPSELPSGGNPEAMPEMLTLTDDTKTITLSDGIPITKQGASQTGSDSTASTNSANSSTEATATDIAVGTVLKITYKSNSEQIASIEIVTGGGQPSGGATVETGTGAYNLKDGEMLTDGTYTSTKADENAIRAENAITASLNNVTVSKTDGAASSSDASSFYGLNAAVLALSDAVLSITGGT